MSLAGSWTHSCLHVWFFDFLLHTTMSKLASRWATEETLVKEALEQDSHVKHTKESGSGSGSSENQVSTDNQVPLVSKWASSPSPPSSPKHRKNHRTSHKLPSPPLTGESDKHDERPRRRRAEGKDGEGSGSKDTRESRRKEPESKGKEPMSEFAKAFADRLDMDGHGHNEKSHRSRRKSRNDHEDRHERHDKTEKERSDKHDKHDRSRTEKHVKGHLEAHEPKHVDQGDILHEKGPMTDAARSLALRIGAPDKGDKKQSKYMTPRQKKELAARIEREKKEHKKIEEDKERQAQLQKEVQEMFDKMSDKSTSWADIEDE